MLSAISAQWSGVADKIGTLPCFSEALKERYLPFLDQKLKKSSNVLKETVCTTVNSVPASFLESVTFNTKTKYIIYLKEISVEILHIN